ncbi:hypothetical protein [Pseudoalteromonas sp. S1688]|uniref:hypothetical protein n=1 Tax=Pseudoalteromonas sp. S1688 TaxID=579511 RepID=UPI00110A585A|nr:hypothetical protein [Pseudoalteromonas sp. S1688]TMP51432.1 hypothetical protein CWB81_05775 [Pseudoalteromonas sp. S1688]
MNPTNILIEKAVDIWCNALKNPRFDNGDSSLTGAMTNSMANELIGKAIENEPDLDKKILFFKEYLTADLIEKSKNEASYFWASLSCDYGPDKNLQLAADKAGIPYNLFSAKSNVYINETFLEAKFGYGVNNTCYYPLPDGRWLKTTLRGDDMEKVINSVMDGNPLGLEVE